MNTTHQAALAPALVAGDRANYVDLTPLSYLSRAAAAFGDRVAIVDRDRHLTYRDFYHRVCRTCAAVRRSSRNHTDH